MSKDRLVLLGVCVAGVLLFRAFRKDPVPAAPPSPRIGEPEPSPPSPAPVPRPSFPVHLRVARYESDYEVQKRKARPVLGSEVATFQYDPMGSHLVEEKFLEVGSPRDLVELLSEADGDARSAAKEKVLALYPDYRDELGPLLLEALGRPELAWAAAGCLAQADPKAALPALLARRKDPDRRVSGAALEGLAYLEDDEARAAVDAANRGEGPD